MHANNTESVEFDHLQPMSIRCGPYLESIDENVEDEDPDVFSACRSSVRRRRWNKKPKCRDVWEDGNDPWSTSKSSKPESPMFTKHSNNSCSMTWSTAMMSSEPAKDWLDSVFQDAQQRQHYIQYRKRCLELMDNNSICQAFEVKSINRIPRSSNVYGFECRAEEVFLLRYIKNGLALVEDFPSTSTRRIAWVA